MRRWPLVASFILFIALCASAAYWAMQLFKPPVRPVAAPPRVAKADVNVDAAAGLLGGRAGKVAVASNYQLRGVIFSGSPHDSVAILSADGKPTQAIRANTEVIPGVTIKEVHRDYVLLSENGVAKRVDLPESAKDLVNLATAAPTSTRSVPAQGTPAAVPEPRAPRVSKSGPPDAAAARTAPAPAPAPAPTPAPAPALPPAVVVNPAQPGAQEATPPATPPPLQTAPPPSNPGGAPVTGVQQ